MNVVNHKTENQPNALDYSLAINRFIWLLGMLILAWATIGRERAVLNFAIVLMVIYLIKND